MSFKIYLVEDDKNLNLILTSYLEKEGWQVSSFLTGEDAKAAINTPPDIYSNLASFCCNHPIYIHIIIHNTTFNFEKFFH